MASPPPAASRKPGSKLNIDKMEATRMKEQETGLADANVEAQRALNKRLESIAWAFFLIMIGGIGLVPKEQVPEGVWSIGVGLIMLGLNAARYYYKIKMSSFTIVLGILALLTGAGELLGVDLPGLAILLILIGAGMILGPSLEKRLS
jgi:hypothetical protein